MNVNNFIPDTNFAGIKQWFSETPYAKKIDGLAQVIIDNAFQDAPGKMVVNFVCDQEPRYFLVPSELARNLGDSAFRHVPVTPAEADFLRCIQLQLDGRVQRIFDAGDFPEAETWKGLPELIRVFEVHPCQGTCLRRFALDYVGPPD